MPSEADEKLQNSPRRAHDLLRTGIRHDLISRDQKLSEHYLTRGYSTSRNAVREALQTLALEGLVTRIPRFGTRVTGRITVLSLADIGPVSLSETPSTLPRMRTEELDLKIVPATPVLQARLEIEDEFVLLVEHLITGDDEPLYVRVAYLPVREEADAFIQRVRDVYADASHSPNSAIHTLFDTDISRVEMTVEAVPCDARTGRLLGLAAGAPILLRERVVFGTNERPCELSFAHLRGDRAALSATIVSCP